jgi:low temperature requirement protein LtrA
MKNQVTEQQEEMRVSTIESFFDLVFVFTITQLTYLVAGARGPLDFLLVLLVLMLIWWMYDAYAWLISEAGTPRPMRLVLIAAMAGFLVMALALPSIVDTSGLAFGLAYLFVVVLHLAAFLITGGRGVRRATLALAPFNLGAAALVIVAGLLHTGWNWLFFLAAVTLFAIATISRREQGFSVNSAHFVERHGLVILIILGEAVVDIGTGAGAPSRALDARTLAAVVLSLLLVAAIWWSYFDRDDERARHALVSASPQARSRMALLGYWYAHLAMIAGIVLIATGVKHVVASPVGPIQEAAWLLAGGMALYLCGDAWFRRVMGIRPVLLRALGAVIVLALGVVGLLWGGGAEIGAIAALAVVLLVIEQRLEQGREPVQAGEVL